jgi:hypothetical protein
MFQRLRVRRPGRIMRCRKGIVRKRRPGGVWKK